MELYEPLIERDLAAIPDAVRKFRESHSSEELFVAVARFALLAYAPSQHAKHALLACLAVHELREEMREELLDELDVEPGGEPGEELRETLREKLDARFDQAVTELAIYAAGSRQPWSEPPITDPPAIEPGQRGDREELLAAIAEGDRHRAERWLAKRVADGGDERELARDYFAAAAHDLEDMGHKLIVATAAWKLVPILGERGRYATLRVGVWEMTAYRGPAVGLAQAMPPEELLEALIGEAAAAHGSLESMHAIFLLEAAMTASSIAGDDSILGRVCAALGPRRRPSRFPLTPFPWTPVYRYARDYAQCLIAHAVAERLATRYPDHALDVFVAAAHENLEHAPSFEDWSFA